MRAWIAVERLLAEFVQCALPFPPKFSPSTPASKPRSLRSDPSRRRSRLRCSMMWPTGEYVLIHVGYALHKVSPEEAERTLAMIREAGEDAELAALVEAAP